MNPTPPRSTVSSSARFESLTEKLEFHTLDVFTNTRYEGNQVAVVLLSDVPDATPLTSGTKQLIAREFNLSETVFLHPPLDKDVTNARCIEIFTPTEELPFAGHPVIGTIALLAILEGLEEGGILMTTAGDIDFECEHDERRNVLARATAKVPHSVRVHKESLEGEALMRMQPDLARHFSDMLAWPVVSITKGMTYCLVEVPSMDALGAVRTSSQKPEVTLDRRWSPSFVGCYFYYRENRTEDHEKEVLHTRMIEPEMGEDPVTGSAACALAAYLALEKFGASNSAEMRSAEYSIIQGEHFGRRGNPRVTVRGNREVGIFKISLCGEAVWVQAGEFQIEDE